MCPRSTALPLAELPYPGAGLCAGVWEVLGQEAGAWRPGTWHPLEP